MSVTYENPKQVGFTRHWHKDRPAQLWYLAREVDAEITKLKNEIVIAKLRVRPGHVADS